MNNRVELRGAMLVGAMNNPQHDLADEIRRAADLGMDFVDVTLEPPGSAPRSVDPEKIAQVAADHRLRLVGHTAWYLPIGSLIERIRRAAIEELKECAAIFSRMGVRWMNFHPDGFAPFGNRPGVVERNVESARELVAWGRSLGVGIMVENVPGQFNCAAQLAGLLDPLPDLFLHLDLGHANLQTSENTALGVIEAFGGRIRHVHLHDNKGGSADLHLPLGAGNMHLKPLLAELKRSGYDDTITLEVFTPDKHYLTYSAEVLRSMWLELDKARPPESITSS